METEQQRRSTITGTYVYCVIPTASVENKSKKFGTSIDASAPVRTVRENGLTAVVSDALQPQYDPSRANVGAHENVVRQAYDLGDVLPMRFGTVARNDEAVERFLHEKHEALEKSLEHLHERAELALKVSWDRDTLLREVLTEDERIRSLREAITGQPESQTHDERVELGRLVNDAMERKREAEADRILERVRAKAVEVDIQRILSDMMILNAALLVDRADIAALDEELNALSAEESGRLTFKYVGPLPPYSFVKFTVPKEG